MSPSVPYFHQSKMQIYSQPVICPQATLFGFILKGKIENLNDLCTANFAQPSNNVCKYVPVSPYVMLTFTDMPHIRSGDQSGRQVDSIAEREVAVWVLTAYLEQTDKGEIASRLAWFVPYMFVDNGFALSAGREIFGLPKQWGWFTFPQPDQSPTSFTADTTVFSRFGADTNATRQRLLEVNRVPGTADDKNRWSDISNALKDIREGLAEHGPVFPNHQLLPNLLNDLVHLELPLVALRQFPDIADGNKACYQAIVEFPAQVNQPLPHLQRLGGSYEVTLNDFDSHPLRKDIGLPDGKIPVLAQFGVEFNVTLGNGREIWRAQPEGESLKTETIAMAVSNKPNGPKKIAILGGGIAALTSAFSLTSDPDWKQKYDITVYQLGWRLGGQAASGRNPKLSNRIEEHGLHIWFGFYENAFSLMRQCYKELNRAADMPLHTISEAFKGLNNFIFREKDKDTPGDWKLEFKSDGSFPGKDIFQDTDQPVFTPDHIWDYIVAILDLMRGHFYSEPKWKPVIAAGKYSTTQDNSKPPWWKRLDALLSESLSSVGAIDIQSTYLEHAHRISKKLQDNPQAHNAVDHAIINWLLRSFRSWLRSEIDDQIKKDDRLHHYWILMELGLAGVIGIIQDRVMTHGFEAIDDIDFRDWLLRNGAHDHAVWIPGIQALYDASFAYKNGDTDCPQLAASAALPVALRTILDYSGSIVWEMQAGMGDAVIAPLYLVLKQRGVKFQFFSCVTSLGLSEDKKSIEEIKYIKQADAPDYDPLYTVNGLPCWPNAPLVEQIRDADKIKDIDLESWKAIGTYGTQQKLSRSEGHFDEVILGISLGTLPTVCGELIAIDPRWQAMISNIPTVQTQALQLWAKTTESTFITDVPEWLPNKNIVDFYHQPYSSWADFTHLLAVETWEKDLVNYLAYSCGVMQGPAEGTTLISEPDVNKNLIENIYQFFSQSGAPTWPITITETGTLQFPDSVHSSYYRVNVEVTDRYVQAPPKTLRYRVRADQSGFANLHLAGTWLNTGFLISSIESAVLSGMQASRSVRGLPVRIFESA